MGSITSIKCVLTQEHLDAICAKYFVPEEVHPQLPSSDATMHERPTGKVGMYTRFFDYANYRIPFSNFFVSVLTHFRIPFSQLSVFGSAKVSHFEILCRVCNINPSVGLFRYFYMHNYKNGWFGFTKRPNVRACYSKNLDSVKNWNDHFFWVDEFVVPANARFGWFSGTNIVKDRAPTISEYNVDHASTLIAQASPFLRFPEEFLCWVGISRNYLLNKDTYPRFEYEDGEEMDLNAFIRTADPRKVRVVERARTENEKPIVTVAKHRTVTLLPTSVPRPSGELSASIEREFVEDAGGSGGGDQEVASVGGHGNVEPIVPTTDNIVAETEASGPKRSKKKRVTRGSESTPAASHPPKRLRADYGKTGGSAAGGKSPSVLNRLLQDSRLMVEQGVPALPTLPFITSSVTASPLEEGGDHTNSVTGPSLRTVGPSARSFAPVMTAATTVTAFVSNAATMTATPVDVGKDKDVPTPSVFAGFSSSNKTDRTLSLFTKRLGNDFFVGSIRAGEAADVDLQEIYISEWSMTKGFELNDGRSCANMIDHFTPPAFFKTVREMMHEQLFAEFNEGLAAGIEHGQAGRCLSDLEAYNPSAEADFNSAVRDLRSLDFSLLRELSAKKDASTWDVMDLLRLDDVVAEVLGMTDLQPDVALSVALETCRRRVRKMERNLTERLPFLKDVFVSIDHPLSAEALTILPETSTEPPVTTLITTALSTVVIRPDSDPFLLVEDYENPDLAGAVPEDVIPGPKGEGKVGGSTEGDVDVGDLVLSQLENEARDAVL
ncbi:hypothetical protein Tco_0451075 [Tanacetum coccineum]